MVITHSHIRQLQYIIKVEMIMIKVENQPVMAYNG